MLNHIVIMGRLTRDPELRRTNTGVAVTRFSVAVDRDFQNKDTGERETDFINCVAWRSTGEFVSKYFSKGSMIVVSGRLQMRTWTDKDGYKRREAEIVADNVYFGSSKRDNAFGNGRRYSSDSTSAGNSGYPEPSPGYGNSYAAPPSLPISDFAMLEDDDPQLPF